MKSKVLHAIRWIISPTLYVSDHYKARAVNLMDRGTRVKRLNRTYFKISFFSLCCMSLIHCYGSYQKWELGVVSLIACYCFSRCNEIFMAFLKDVFDKLSTIKRNKNGLEYYERIQLALRSYIELIINYGILYFFVDCYGYFIFSQSGMFNQPLKDVFNALYFSVITIVSLGYGDYAPTHPMTKFLVIYEVMNGMLLLVVSFTVYVSLTLKE